MKIQNRRIIAFFESHPALDPESTILKFVDIMETLHTNMAGDAGSSMAADILENLRAMNSKIDSVSSDVGRIAEDADTRLESKLSEARQGYVAALGPLLSSNVTEHVAPLLRQQGETLLAQTTSLIREAIPKDGDVMTESMRRIVADFQRGVQAETQSLAAGTVNRETLDRQMRMLGEQISSAVAGAEKRLEGRIEDVRTLSSEGTSTTASLNSSVGSLLKKFENSSAKGKLSENLLQNILEKLYPAACVQSVGTTKETGDIIMDRPHKPRLLIENKCWNRNVVQTEVAKFIRDAEKQDCCAIFLSQNNAIATKRDFEIDIHNGNVLVYLHHVNNDPDRIRLAVDVVDHLKGRLDDLASDGEESGDVVPKEVLERINSEYHSFVSQKTALTRTTREFNKRMIKQIDELRFPSLEGYLSKKFSFSSSKFKCEYCDFVGKNQQSLSAHLRGCAEKKRILAGQNTILVK